MKRNTAREMTLEEYDAWAASTKRHEAVAKAADEEGGPRLSLVPLADRDQAWPTDLLAPSAGMVAGATTDPQPMVAEPFDGIPLDDSRKRSAGWSAERQRLFLSVLAETGSVHLASTAARLSARSAYRLRARSPAFAAAWDVAQQLAVGRLSALAFDRAINGRTDQVWQSGELVAEKKVPSDRLLMWLLARLDPRRFAGPGERGGRDTADPQAEAMVAFPTLLDALADAVAD